jgi:hypothetical protein
MPLPLSRLVVIFHNILLLLWIHWAYELASLPKGENLKPRGIGSVSRKYSPVLTVALVMLTANIAGFAAIAASPWYHAIPDVWAMACLAAGALVGFVFGVPKWVRPNGRDAKRERYEPNANIEKLSDWLTKIVVGVGLVELHQIGPTIGRMSDVLAMGVTLGPGRTSSAEEAKAFASGVIVYFFAAGVIQGFLLIRMFMTRAWQASENV